VFLVQAGDSLLGYLIQLVFNTLSPQLVRNQGNHSVVKTTSHFCRVYPRSFG